MLSFLLILFIVFIVIPILRLLWAGWKLRRRWMEATSGMRDAYRRAAEEAAKKTKQPKKKKKIDPSVGEYVSFEELKVETTVTSETTADGSSTKIRVESQVEDVTWEELPPNK